MNMNEETRSNQEFDPYFAEKFCNEIVDSDIDPIEKIKKFSGYPKFGGDLVAEMLEHGSHLENYFEHKAVFSNGEDVEDVVHGAIDVFEAIIKCAEELDLNKLSVADKKFVLGAYTASRIAQIYFDLFDLLEEGTYEEKYNACSMIIKMCAVYFEDAHVMFKNDLVYYRFGQQSKLDEIAEAWKDVTADAAEESMPKAEKSSAQEGDKEEKAQRIDNDGVKEAQNQAAEDHGVPSDAAKNKRKLSSFGIIALVCSGALVLLTILAILLKNSVINFIMVGTGIVELIIAYVLFSKKRKYDPLYML